MTTKTPRPAWSDALLAGLDEKQIMSDLRTFDEDCAWLAANRDHLKGEHPDKFIAVYERRIVAIADTHEELMNVVRRKGLPLEKCVTEVLLTENLVLVV